MERTRFRQVHLDFHTSPEIPDIGSRFDPDEFGDTLQAAGVDSINLFAKCHHGMYYYPTKIGTMHPGLDFDLLGAQMEACAKRNIRTFAYTCVGWNEDWADRHPEWLQIDPEGVLGLRRPFADGYYGWRSLCVGNREHRAYIKDELTEIHERYGKRGLAGFWIDIVMSRRCVCPSCRKEMVSKGQDPRDPSLLAKHDMRNEISFMQEITAHIRSLDSDLMVYYNGMPYQADLREEESLSSARKREAMSFIDIESLPSDAWGYTHFPVNVNYLNKYAQELTMMNGKFHLAWGDFGSLRNAAAMEYEVFRALGHGTKVCVGDQLHPSGRLEPAAYDRIGRVLRSVAQKEPWCRGTIKLREVAVYFMADAHGTPHLHMEGVQEGVYRLLSELRVPFDFVDFRDSLEGYRLVILPEGLRLTREVGERITRFLEGGGKVLVTGDGGLLRKEDRYAFDGFCMEYLGQAEFAPRYIRIPEGFAEDIAPMDYVVYARCATARAKSEADVLARVVEPYFNRSYDRFCSHRQTPPARSTDEPAIATGRNCAYVSAPIFSDYAQHGLQFYKLLLARVLGTLLPDPLLRIDLPSTGEAMLRQQGGNIVLHALNYVIQRKCRALDTIEDRWPLHDVAVSIRTDRTPLAVRLVPEGTEIPFTHADGRVAFRIPDIDGHRIVVIET